MRFTGRRVGAFVGAFLLTACGNPLGGNKSTADDGYHPGLPPAAAAPPPALPAAIGGDTGVKIAPGMMRAVGSNLGLKAAITNTDHLATGSAVSARLSLHKETLR